MGARSCWMVSVVRERRRDFRIGAARAFRPVESQQLFREIHDMSAVLTVPYGYISEYHGRWALVCTV